MKGLRSLFFLVCMVPLLAGCLALFASLPLWALLTGGAALAAVTGIRWLVRHQQMPKAA